MTKIQGVKFTFKKPAGKSKVYTLELRIGEIIEKHLEIKKNEKVIIELDRKNNFILLLRKKTRISAQKGFSYLRFTNQKCGVIRINWYNSKQIPKHFKKSSIANYKLLENNQTLINLLPNRQL